MTSVTEQLKDLAELLEKGLITREEFDAEKRKLLGETPPPSSVTPSPSPPPVGGDLTGQRIGEYRLDRKLGEGGMGAVYLGVHTAMEQRVAVKVLDATLARNRDIRTRFIQEANIQSRLLHPGIVRVLTAHTQGERVALVMEHIDGMALDQVLERRGELPVDEAMELFRQVLEAVEFAHSQDEPVIHRDIKPSNVMVTAAGTAKVMDFGIAKVMGGDRLTRTGTAMGSAHYMSPEQVLGRKDIDHRTDVYSLGVTLFEMLTGRVPFEDSGVDTEDSDFVVKQAHVSAECPDPRQFRSDLPDAVVAALMRALQKNPEQRFPSCAAFLEGLTRSADPPRRSEPTSSPSRKSPSP